MKKKITGVSDTQPVNMSHINCTNNKLHKHFVEPIKEHFKKNWVVWLFAVCGSLVLWLFKDIYNLKMTINKTDIRINQLEKLENRINEKINLLEQRNFEIMKDIILGNYPHVYKRIDN